MTNFERWQREKEPFILQKKKIIIHIYLLKGYEQ